MQYLLGFEYSPSPNVKTSSLSLYLLSLLIPLCCVTCRGGRQQKNVSEFSICGYIRKRRQGLSCKVGHKRPQKTPLWLTLALSDWNVCTKINSRYSNNLIWNPNRAKCYIHCNTCVIEKSEKLPFLWKAPNYDSWVLISYDVKNKLRRSQRKNMSTPNPFLPLIYVWLA